ncbi:hypothetical protein NWE55_14170 [Myroides albus]|uniref:hypothetical protein n=1 Tax=Myroides albus TaxID=2562892 RepID=UPI0021594462|nr:hypothetical protein [Myroides albus]UVD79260.1 hypothetical protein NWE55_14170 [Myroides albus]
MAILTAKNQLKGLVGPGYYREFRGQLIFQTKPDRSKQDKTKNKNAPVLRKLSSAIRYIRCHIESHLNNLHDSYMHSRLLGQLIRIVHKDTTKPLEQRTLHNVNFGDLSGFEFNNNTLFKDTFLNPISVTTTENRLTAYIPAFVPKEQVVFPKGCTQALIRLYVIAIQAGDRLTKDADEIRQVSIEFNREQPIVQETTWTCPSMVEEEKFEVMVADIQFFYPINNTLHRTSLYNTKAFNPSMIIYAK